MNYINNFAKNNIWGVYKYNSIIYVFKKQEKFINLLKFYIILHNLDYSKKKYYLHFNIDINII